MRLAFAVAAHLDPEILIVDEVLAVGDAAFQKKCLGKMGDVAKQGRTVLFVSHNLGAVRSLCTRAIVLAGGAMQFDGPVEDAIARYLSSAADRAEKDGQVSFGAGGLAFDQLAVLSVCLRNEAGEVRALFDATEPITIDIEYQVTARLPGARTVIALGDVGRRGGVSVHRSSDAGRGTAARPLPDVVPDPGRAAERADVRGRDRLRHPRREDARAAAPVPLVRRRGRDRSRRGLVAGHREPSASLGHAPGVTSRRASGRPGRASAGPGGRMAACRGFRSSATTTSARGPRRGDSRCRTWRRRSWNGSSGRCGGSACGRVDDGGPRVPRRRRGAGRGGPDVRRRLRWIR